MWYIVSDCRVCGLNTAVHCIDGAFCQCTTWASVTAEFTDTAYHNARGRHSVHRDDCEHGAVWQQWWGCCRCSQSPQPARHLWDPVFLLYLKNSVKMFNETDDTFLNRYFTQCSSYCATSFFPERHKVKHNFRHRLHNYLLLIWLNVLLWLACCINLVTSWATLVVF